MTDSTKPSCAVLVSSCDAYKDLWDPFFRLMQIHWKDLAWPVYLNTEQETFDGSRFGFPVRTLNLEQRIGNAPWSSRFAYALRRIPEEFVIHLLDDFFLTTDVHTQALGKIIDTLAGDSTAASFQMGGTRTHIRLPSVERAQLPFHFRILPGDGYPTHFVPTVWRKSVLLKWLRPWESIWGFEAYGSQRVKRWKYPEKVFLVDSPPIIDYAWFSGKTECSAVVNGKWLDNQDLRDLFTKNGIAVDFSKRGFITEDQYMSVTMRDILRRYSYSQILVRSLNRFRSLF